MDKISSTLYYIHKGIVDDIESQYKHRDKKIKIKNYLLRPENAENNDYQTGIFFDIESMDSSNHFYCIVTYHIIEIIDNNNINGMVCMMNNMDTMKYSITKSGQTQVLARSSPRICVVDYHSQNGVREVPDTEIEKIEVNYIDIE